MFVLSKQLSNEKMDDKSDNATAGKWYSSTD